MQSDLFCDRVVSSLNSEETGNASIQGFVFPGTIPMAVVNVSSTSQTTSYGATLDPSQIMLHPDSGIYAILRFTAPTTGNYTIVGDWESLHPGITTNRVLRNSTTLISSNADNSIFNLALTLTAGEKIDFSVDNFDGVGFDSTGLRAVLTLTTVPEPTSLTIILGLSGIGLAIGVKRCKRSSRASLIKA